MLINVDSGALGRTKWYEYLIRFIFGGAITAIAGLIGSKFGPVVGGLFMAFPAIFPASAKHQQARKEKIGLHGSRRGTYAAADDAMGATIGSLALISFALTCWLLFPRYPPGGVLAGATAVWVVMAVSIWMFRKRHLRRIARALRVEGHADPQTRQRRAASRR